MSNIPRTVYYQKELTAKQQDQLADLCFEYNENITRFREYNWRNCTNIREYQDSFIYQIKLPKDQINPVMVAVNDPEGNGIELPFQYYTSLPSQHKWLYIQEKSIQGALKLRKRYLSEFDEREKKLVKREILTKAEIKLIKV